MGDIKCYRSKKVTIDDPKHNVKVVHMQKGVHEANVQCLYNAGAKFMDEFLKIQENFLGEASDDESTEWTDDTECGDEDDEKKKENPRE